MPTSSSRHPVNRPRIPLLRRLMQDPTRGATFLGQTLRALSALTVVVNPVLTTLCALSLARTRVRGWWLAVGGLAAGAVDIALGAWNTYWLMWRDLLAAAG